MSGSTVEFMRSTRLRNRLSFVTSTTAYRPVFLVLGVVSGLLIISGGVSAENGRIAVNIFEPEGFTVLVLLSTLTVCLGMCGTLVYELFFADIVRMRELVEDYLE